MREIWVQWQQEGLCAPVNDFGGSAASLRDTDVSQRGCGGEICRCVVEVFGSKTGAERRGDMKWKKERTQIRTCCLCLMSSLRSTDEMTPFSRVRVL